MDLRYLTFVSPEPSTFRVAILVPELIQTEIERHYLPLLEGWRHRTIAIKLPAPGNSLKMAEKRAWIAELLPLLQNGGVTHLAIADSAWFQAFAAKRDSAEKSLGYLVPIQETGIFCTPVANYQSVFYNPKKVKDDIALAFAAVMNGLSGTYVPPGRGILKEAHYPRTTEEIALWLDRLIEMDCDLTSDIEGFSLKAEKSHIATIAFAWNKHSGVAFACDWEDVDPETNEDGHHGRFRLNQEVRDLLENFFIRFKRKIIFHQITHDASVLIRHLFMRNIIDTEGLLNGLDVVLKNFDDTKLISYLATNSCAGNLNGLKEQAKEFAGSWAEEDIKDIRRIPLPALLEYNLIDVLATWHVREKYWDRMVNDEQLPFYEQIFKPAVLDVVQMQLTGLPVNMEEVKRFEVNVLKARDDAVTTILSNPVIVSFNERLNEIWAKKKNETLKKKRVSAADGKEVFNPNSGPQLQELFYEFLGFPAIDRTDSGAPATGADTLKKLMARASDPQVLSLIQALVDYSSVDKIVTSFLPSLLNAEPGPDGWHYLMGSFNLGGTVSGRLSSSNPNMQNLPANSPWAKAFKACIQAPPGWLFGGLDFSSLEDRISALTTKDPNKLEIYTKGYDGHSLRAFAYFGDQMPDIVAGDVESINSIQTKYKSLRQDSKTPTFLLTYQGTWHGIIEQLNWPEEKAKAVEAAYHDLYKVSDEWVAKKTEEAGRLGYVTVAFGLRLRTPLLVQVVLGTSRTPYAAKSEARTMGNALGQSWGLLNNRAASEFMGKVRKSQYRLDIRPCSHIHDAQYYLLRDDSEVVLYTNEHLVRAVQWQDHPDIWHDEVKIGGELSLFMPSWAHECVLPNGVTAKELLTLAAAHVAALVKKGVLPKTIFSV